MGIRWEVVYLLFIALGLASYVTPVVAMKGIKVVVL